MLEMLADSPNSGCAGIASSSFDFKYEIAPNIISEMVNESAKSVWPFLFSEGFIRGEH